MNISNNVKVAAGLAISGGLAVGGWLVIEGVFRDRIADLNALHRLHLADRRSAWDLEASGRRLEDQRADQRRLVRQHEELIAAFGGPVSAAARNPRTDIAGMLRDVCELCAGETGATRVEVDRFTEFSLVIDMERVGPEPAPEKIIHCVLRHCAAYVHAIQFHRRGIVVAELDRRAIESVADWGAASDETVRRLVAEMNEASGVSVASADAGASQEHSGDDENLPLRTQRLKKALNQMDAAANHSIQKINGAVRLQLEALNAQSARSANEFAAATDQLTESARVLSEAKAFFIAPVDYYRRMMVEAGLDQLYIDAETRSRRKVEDAVKSSLALEIIAKAEKRGQTVGRLLQLMRDAGGTWSYDLLTRQFQFDYPETAKDYRKIAEQMALDSADLEAAFDRWKSAK